MQNDLSHSMVHYLLTIHKLKEGKGYARVTDIAKDLKLTKGSVSTALNNLKKRDLVAEEEDSKFLRLTENGHKEVHKILSSRLLLFHFLRDILKVSSEVAANDACMMEHLMSGETRKNFFRFMKEQSNDHCSACGRNELGRAISELDLSDFESAESFVEAQAAELNLLNRN